jgi:release factor glutamine methyltransferase
MASDVATAAPPVWTVRTLLHWTTDFLSKKGIEAPALEARLLLAHVLDCKPIEVLVRSFDEPTDAERTQFRELIGRRVQGWPVAYLVGSKDFYLLRFEVTPAVLIPRPDTETLVQKALDLLKERPTARVLDIGTGSGCIAISLKHGCPGIDVLAVDVSPDALDVARRNAKTHGVGVSFAQGDLFAPVTGEPPFDLIVSNPPYIAPSAIAELAPDVRDHEPRIALDGGPDGLAFYRRLVADAGDFLKPGGTLLLEIGYDQNDAVRALFAERPEWALGETICDLGNRHRVIVARRV